MKFIMTWILKHPVLAVMLALLITLLCATQLPKLKIDTSANSLIIQDSPAALFYNDTKKIFGDDNTLSIVYKAADIFRPHILQSIEDVSFKAAEIDGVTRVVSLTTVNNLRADAEGYLNTDTLLPYVPETEAEIALVRDNTLANELIHGEVINKTGTVAAIQLSIQDRPNEPLFSQTLAQNIEKVLAHERSQLGEKVEIYQIGNLILANTMMNYIQHDMALVIPLSLAVIFLILLGFFRSGATVILPIITGTLSIIVSLGLMAILDFSINPISLIVPSLLLIIGSTEDIHILAEYELGIRDYQQKQLAINRMAQRSGLVVFLTALTTFCGFYYIRSKPYPYHQ